MAATSYATEQQAILTRIQDNWTEEVDVAWPNTQFDPAGAAHLEPIVNRQDAFNADLTPSPNRRVRHPGLLTLNVRVPLGTGDGEALRLADVAAALFRNVSFDGITFRAPTVRDIGEEGPWYRVQVDCPFYRDSLH